MAGSKTKFGDIDVTKRQDKADIHSDDDARHLKRTQKEEPKDRPKSAISG